MKFLLQRNAKKFILLLMVLFAGTLVFGSDTPDPNYVTIAGSLQSEVGSNGDWQPESSVTYLNYDPVSKIWTNTFTIPAGDYEYKAALNNSWDENYGLNGVFFGANIPLSLAEETPVKFFYDHETHWITDNVNSYIVTLPGDYLTHLGASGDWQPEFLGTWMQDKDGDGIYTFITTALPAGNYQCKVTINESWHENYGENGVPGGNNITFTVPEDNGEVFFSYDSVSHILTITDGAPKGNLNQAEAIWVNQDTLAWNINVEANYSATLHYSLAGDLAISADGIDGGDKITLTYEPAGLSQEVLAKFPHITGYTAFKINPVDLDKIPIILDGKNGVALFNEKNELLDATA
ncbi:MAG: DUF3372 domain-containing protein, partial [Spirochaetes bacterium]|nr:DUF3372 domain-containing protein [Spirochaetota bacterium]